MSRKIYSNQISIVSRQDHFEELKKGKEKPSHWIYRLQESVWHGAYSWLKETLKMVVVADNICRLGQSMCNWKAVLTSNRDTLSKVSIQRAIFQRDSLSHYYSLFFSYHYLWLWIVLIMLIYFQKRLLINHLIFMADLHLYGKTQR